MQNYFKLQKDRYSGITIVSFPTPYKIVEFEEALVQLLQNPQNKKLLWIKLSIVDSELIPLLRNNGFVFHHCNEQELMLVKKLEENPIIPTAKNHTLGVGVVVVKENKLLTIKDRIYQTYKLPGGFIDDNENISQAVVREVYEETGVEVEFESVVSLGHFTPAQFGESNLYVISVAKPLTTEIQIKDTDEIEEARWIDIDVYLNHEDVLPYNKALVQNALKSSKGLQIDNEIELTVRAKTEYELFF
jgi:8-oxo-dGTP diphosphatase